MFKRGATTLLLLLHAGMPALAADSKEPHPWMDSRFILEVGIFYPERLARLTAQGSVDVSLPSPNQDFGSQVSLSQSDSTFSAEVGWRMGDKWTMRMQYFDSRGASTAALDEDIQWEDLTFLAGTNITVGFEFELTRAVWDYLVLSDPGQRLGLSVGFHWLHIRGFVEGTVLTDNGQAFAGESASVDAPLPNVGFTYSRALNSRWGFRTRLDWFSADIHPYDGIFINASAGFNYRFADHFGIGVNYNYVDLDVGVNGDNWRGEVNTRFNGLYVYLDAVW